MSDSESIVSSVFEDIPSENNLSDMETTIESTEPQRIRLFQYEYVSVTINIEATLCRDFVRHSRHHPGIGKFFQVDSENAAERMSRLVDEFLSIYDIPTSQRIAHHSNHDNTKYPRFIPSRWIMLVWQQFPFHKFQFLPVRVLANKPMPIPSSTSDRLMFAWINHPITSPPSHYPVLRSNPPFFIEPGLLQHIPSAYSFKVATVTDGPPTLLLPRSIQILEGIRPIAKDIALRDFFARQEKAQKQSHGLSDQSAQPRHSQREVSFLNIGDIVVDVDRTIGTSPPSMDVSIDEEIDRVLQISEYFILWCIQE